MKIHDSIIIADDILESEEFLNLKKYCTEEIKFESVEKGDHIYFVAQTPKNLEDKILQILQEIHKKQIDVAISFLRLANSKIDINLRVHCDNGNVAGKFNPTHGAVFYITHDSKNLNGTAFWKHKEFGYTCPDNFTNNDIQNKIMVDKEDSLKWDLSTIIGGVENRLVTYPAKYFHSKYPRIMGGKDLKDSRIIMALFYKI
jgi:hypothetical protein